MATQTYRFRMGYRNHVPYRGAVSSDAQSGAQWYDIKYERIWVKNHNDEWIQRIVQEEDWMMDYILAEDDIF